MRPVATRIPRENLAIVPEGTYIIAGETCILKQTSPRGRDYEGPHVKMAHVKSGNTDISKLDEDTRRKLNVCMRDDGNITLEGWVRADQVEIIDSEVPVASRGGKYVCEACSKDLGTVVVSSKAICPRCTSLCVVVSDPPQSEQEPMLKRLNQVIKLDRTITARMKLDIEALERKRLAELESEEITDGREDS